MRNRYFSCYLRVAFLLQNHESFFRKNFASPTKVCFELFVVSCCFSIFLTCFGSGAILSSEMVSPKKLTLSTGFELDFFSSKVRYFSRSQLLTASFFYQLFVGSSIHQHIALKDHNTFEYFECSFDAILED